MPQHELTLSMIQQKIIESALAIRAIKIQPDNPFTWASRYRMPIYNDNRRSLRHPEIREYVVTGFVKLIDHLGIEFDEIAGTATAGISWAALLADYYGVPMSYIRPKPKDHGLENLIEGLDKNEDFGGARVLVIEDLISTGGSSAEAVQAVYAKNGVVVCCVSIFNYGFPEAQHLFDTLEPPCKVASLITYPMLLEQAVTSGYLKAEQIAVLAEWNQNPWEWGANHGFPRVPEKTK